MKQYGLLCDRKGERANVAPLTQEAALMRLNVASLCRLVKGKHVEFVRQELTSYNGLELLRRYLRHVDLPRRLRAACAARTVGTWLRQFTHATIAPLVQLNHALVIDAVKRPAARSQPGHRG